jgi:DNA polymerase
MTSKLKWAPTGPQPTFEGPSSPAVVLHWIRERDRIFRGEGSTDELISRGRFCCVRRQDDRGTRWLHEQWLEPNRDALDLWFLALLYRACINDGRVCAALTVPLPWDAERYLAEMRARKAEGKPVEHFGHVAYRVANYPGYDVKFEGQVDALLNAAWQSREHFRPRRNDTCATFAGRLQELPRIGPFLAGQVVADLKFFAPLCNTPDVMTLATPGPGSERGLARVRGKPLDFYSNNEAQWQRDFHELLAQLAPEIEQILGAPLSASDFQSCLCECDKLERYRVDHGELQAYTPYGEVPPKKAQTRRPTITTTEDIQKRTAVPAATGDVQKRAAAQALPPVAHALPELAAARDPNAPHVLFHDVETRSKVDLKAEGAFKYAAEPTTEALCVAYAVGDEPVQLWVPGDPVPMEFIAAANDTCWTIVAHNDAFERAISRHILEPRHGFPAIPIERRRCSMAAALALALPPGLDDVADALGLEHRKDAAGHRVMQLMARPKLGGGWFDDAERREKLYAYCRQDVEVERELYRRTAPLTSDEQALWQLDAKINERGLHLDGSLLNAAIQVAEAARRDINDELCALTGGDVDTIDKRDKLQRWLATHDCAVTDMQKGTLRRALTRKGIPPEARRAIELRLDGAHAAANKLETMRSWRNGDGRVRGAFRFHGASTGRWTSLGVQLQNLKRPETEDLGAAIAAVATGDLDQVRHISSQPMSVVGDVSRALICAAPGHRLITADFSGVESRVTAWVSGQQSKLDQWAKFDRTQDPADEPYAVLGHRLGFEGQQARALGKIADLAFGYMGSIGAWKKLAPADDASTEDQIKRHQQAWRNAHPDTVRFWRGIEGAAIYAIRKPGQTFVCKRVAFTYEGDFLRMRLPSGRQISYPFPKLITNNYGNRAVSFMDYEQGRWVECRHGFGAYGGTFIENAVQAISRDVFAAAMQRLESAGYSIVLHVHDEICAEVPEGFGSAAEFLKLITTPPSWAEGLPIAAKTREGLRFAKADSKGLPRAAVVPVVTPERATERVAGAFSEEGPHLDTPEFSHPACISPETTAETVAAASDSGASESATPTVPPPPPPPPEDPPPRGNGGAGNGGGGMPTAAMATAQGITGTGASGNTAPTATCMVTAGRCGGDWPADGFISIPIGRATCGWTSTSCPTVIASSINITGMAGSGSPRSRAHTPSARFPTSSPS